jgi:hypothetical protein
MNINDRELLARTLQAEAGNQGFGGMLAAGSVIMNRASSSGYGNGVRGVILKPGQFSAWNSVTGYAGGEQGQDMQGMTPSADAYRAADQLIAGDYSDPTAGATHYFNPDISQPSWAKGKQFHRIGDHVFGRADGKPVDPDQAIADKTMTALGKGPRGILAAPEPEAQPMIAKQQPQGLLGSLGIQKMQPGAEGEAGQRFYERDTFKDTAARLSQGFAALGGNPAVQKFASDVAAQRTEGKARNKTVAYLRKAGRTDLADMVEKGLISGRDAAGAIMQQPKDDRTSLMKNYEFYIGKGMSPEEAMQAVKSGTSISVNTGAETSKFGKAPEGTVWALDAEGNHAMETDPTTGLQRPKTVPLEGTAAQDRAIKAQGLGIKNQAAADRAADSLSLIDDIINDPWLDQITGMVQGRLPPLTQGGTNLNIKIEQLKGQAFLQAFESLKGGGQITEREGLAATNAMGRLQREQDGVEYRKALNELRNIVDRARRRALGQDVPDLGGGVDSGVAVGEPY